MDLQRRQNDDPRADRVSEVVDALRAAQVACAGGDIDAPAWSRLLSALCDGGAPSDCALAAFDAEQDGGIVWTQGMGAALAPLAQQAMARGVLLQDGAALALPLLHEGETIGALATRLADPDAAEAALPRLQGVVAPAFSGCLASLRLTRRRLQTASHLRNSEQRYRALVEVSNELVQSVAPDGSILFVNAAWRRALGCEAEPLDGRPIFDFIHPESQEHCMLAMKEVFHGKQLRAVEVSMRTRMGDKILVCGDVLPRIVDGVVVSTQAFFRDVTEQRQAEAEQARRKAFLDQVVESAPEALLFLDLEGRVQRINSEFTALFGYTADECLGQHIDTLVVPENLRAEGHDLCQRASHFESVNIETVRRRKDGSLVEVSLLAKPISVDGQQVATLGIYRDISGRKKLEAQLARAQRMEAIGRLAGGISHDFNNLLTVINTTADLLSEDLGASDVGRAELDEISRAGEKAAALTRQLLAFSRKQVLTPTVLRLNDIVQDVVRMLRRVIGEDIELSAALAPDLASVKADASQVEQVLMNLALNARDAMPDGGSLRITTANRALQQAEAEELGLAAGPYVELCVRDTGCGIAPELQERIFEPFYTTKAADGRGNGLGLATVYGIVRQSGGAILVDSAEGKGATFTVLLPESSEQPKTKSAPQQAPRAGTNETVLIVEDDQSIRMLVERALGNAGYRTIAATSPAEAMALVERHGDEIALLFTDVVMPDMSGPELAQRLVALRPGLKVLFTSGYADDKLFADPKIGESTQFLAKPYTFTGLVCKVREALDAE